MRAGDIRIVTDADDRTLVGMPFIVTALYLDATGRTRVKLRSFYKGGPDLDLAHRDVMDFTRSQKSEKR